MFLSWVGPRSVIARSSRPFHLPVGVLGETDRARLSDPLEPRGDIDAVAHQVAVGLLDHVAEMDADAAFGRRAIDMVLRFVIASGQLCRSSAESAAAFDAPVITSIRRRAMSKRGGFQARAIARFASPASGCTKSSARASSSTRVRKASVFQFGLVASGFLCAIALSSAAAQARDWPFSGHDIHNTRNAAAATPSNNIHHLIPATAATRSPSSFAAGKRGTHHQGTVLGPLWPSLRRLAADAKSTRRRPVPAASSNRPVANEALRRAPAGFCAIVHGA